MWTKESQETFQLLESKVTKAPILVLLNVEEVFKVHCYALTIGIDGVLNQSAKSIFFFSEKLYEARQRNFTFNKEFYAIMRCLKYWRHDLFSKKFILYSNYKALKYINGQHNLNLRHVK